MQLTGDDQEDLVLIAKEGAHSDPAESFDAWLQQNTMTSDHDLLRNLKVRLRPSAESGELQKLFYLPRGEWQAALAPGANPEKCCLPITSEPPARLDVGELTRWVEAIIAPWTQDYRDAVAQEDTLDQIRVWNRLDGLRELVKELCSARDLEWLDRSLYAKGVPAHEPLLASDDQDADVIDLRPDGPNEGLIRTRRRPGVRTLFN